MMAGLTGAGISGFLVSLGGCFFLGHLTQPVPRRERAQHPCPAELEDY